jgi:hypothetical protein
MRTTLSDELTTSWGWSGGLAAVFLVQGCALQALVSTEGAADNNAALTCLSADNQPVAGATCSIDGLCRDVNGNVIEGFCADVEEPPDACTKIENEQIGVENLAIDVSGTSVTIYGWVEKSDSPGEYVGFSYSPGDLPITVKAGGESYTSDSSPWVNPFGDAGDEVSGISNITFCLQAAAEEPFPE